MSAELRGLFTDELSEPVAITVKISENEQGLHGVHDIIRDPSDQALDALSAYDKRRAVQHLIQANPITESMLAREARIKKLELAVILVNAVKSIAGPANRDNEGISVHETEIVDFSASGAIDLLKDILVEEEGAANHEAMHRGSGGEAAQDAP